MKKLFMIPLIIVLAVGLFLGGCGGTAEPTAPTAPTTPTAPTAPTTPTAPTAPTTPTAPTAPTTPTAPTAPAAPEVIKLKLATFQPLGDIIDRALFWPWMEEIEERTNGRVEIEQYGGAALGAPPQYYEIVLSGTADIAMVDIGATPGVFPLMEAAVLPMLCPSGEVAGRIVWDLIEKYMIDNPLAGLTEVKPLWYIPAGGLGQLTTRTKQVTTMEDLKGMKIIETQPLLAKALEKLGASPVVMPPTEMYTSLERGLVDGVVVGWTSIGCTWQLYDVTKYRTEGVDFATSPLIIPMNLDSWNSLPPDIQEIFIETSGAKLSRLAGKAFDEEGLRCRALCLEYDKKVGNPEVYKLPAAERARWVEAVQPVYAEWIAEKEAMGLPAQAMMDDLYSLVEKYSAE